jgi:hypothetical protein
VKSVRETLVASHISAIAVAVLLFLSLEYAVRALAQPLPSVVGFLATAIAIGGKPYISQRLSIADQFGLIPALFYLFWAVANLVAAWLLSRWMYGTGPFASLKGYGPVLARRNHV